MSKMSDLLISKTVDVFIELQFDETVVIHYIIAHFGTILLMIASQFNSFSVY